MINNPGRRLELGILNGQVCQFSNFRVVLETVTQVSSRAGHWVVYAIVLGISGPLRKNLLAAIRNGRSLTLLWAAVAEIGQVHKVSEAQVKFLLFPSIFSRKFADHSSK